MQESKENVDLLGLSVDLEKAISNGIGVQSLLLNNSREFIKRRLMVR